MTGVIMPVDAGATAAPAGEGMGQGLAPMLANSGENKAKAKL